MASRKYTQEPPFAVQIELAEGCNLRCSMCGLNGIRTEKDHNFKFMKPKTLESLVSQMSELEWTARVEFAMHGEPTMHPEYARMISIAREHLPRNQLMMTSNGGGLLRPPGVVANLTALFEAGLNVFAFDAYEYVKIKDKVDEALSGTSTGELPFEVHRYPDEPEWSPHSRYPRSARLFIRVKDILTADTGTHSTVNNHCGAGSPPNEDGWGKRCAKPFRELAVRWDGRVAICCNDWRGEFKVGSVVDDGLDAVWQAPSMMAARKLLLRGDRESLEPCRKCDAVSYRVGLLPDKMGKARMPRFDDSDARAIAKATRGQTLTKAVRRDWE